MLPGISKAISVAKYWLALLTLTVTFSEAVQKSSILAGHPTSVKSTAAHYSRITFGQEEALVLPTQRLRPAACCEIAGSTALPLANRHLKFLRCRPLTVPGSALF